MTKNEHIKSINTISDDVALIRNRSFGLNDFCESLSAYSGVDRFKFKGYMRNHWRNDTEIAHFIAAELEATR